MCTQCNGFFSRTHLWRHKLKCKGESAADPTAIPAQLIKSISANSETTIPADFRNQISTKFSNDDAGRMCQTDGLGRYLQLDADCSLYDKIKRKQDKVSEVGKNVRTDMRRLAILFMTFKQVKQ